MTDPLGLWPYYERWGGPNWTAGRRGSWDDFSEEFRQNIQRQIRDGWDPNSSYEPLDDQDTCYMQHDICHGESRMHCQTQQERCPDQCLRDRLNRCDFDLTICLVNIGLSDNLLSEAHRIAAIPVFIIQPGVRNAIYENRENGTKPLAFLSNSINGIEKRNK